MIKLLPLLFLIIISNSVYAQQVNVQADYNAMGDCLFSAYNNTKVPMFLNIDLADLENTVFTEPLPYVKKLDPGFNSLFTLLRDPDADVPRFTYQLRVFRSNPVAKVDLSFPYVLPFKTGEEVEVVAVDDIDGFWGQDEPESWYATGFSAQAGDEVFATRSGIIAEVVGESRSGEAQKWYNAWTNAITVLQEDGTLICYHNVIGDSKVLKVGEKVFAGQEIGKIAKNANTLVILIWHESLFSKSPRFIIPRFVSKQQEVPEILIVSNQYTVVHPQETLELEMSAKEKRKVRKQSK